ncbi:MAG TPA: GAF domain-containing protein, partial [Xenococcaceae cyanobacterium]
MSNPQTNNNQQSSWQTVTTEGDPEVTVIEITQPGTVPNTTTTQSDWLEPETAKLAASEDLINNETESPKKPFWQELKAKTAAILVGSAVMLPILAVGTATYYLGSQGLKQQEILARRIDRIGVAETELARQQRLLAALLIGTGTTALLAGAIAAWLTKRYLEAISKTFTKATETETQIYIESVPNLSQSVSQPEILQNIVREAQKYLNCDRVVVYSLNQDKYGVIIAESVAPGFPKALGKTIDDPCFAAKYLAQYRDGRVRAIDNIYEADLTACHIEQLEELEVKANLVTPIIHDKRLFGLLIAHQCTAARQWQKSEIEFLERLAKKTAMVLENAKLLNDLLRLQQQTETEHQWTQYFTNAIQYIRQSLKQADVLEISVEEVRRVLECDRVVVYSLNQDRYGVVVAESVAAGYPRALNKTISDPCFEVRYLEKYRDGRVRAIDNIYEA